MTDFVLHRFRPTETIDAVMRLKGRHNYTLEELIILRERFNRLNGLHVPKVGDVYKIPILEENGVSTDPEYPVTATE